MLQLRSEVRPGLNFLAANKRSQLPIRNGIIRAALKGRPAEWATVFNTPLQPEMLDFVRNYGFAISNPNHSPTKPAADTTQTR